MKSRAKPEKSRAVSAPVVKDTASYSQQYLGVDFRQHPERYRIGKGEQGVLLAEPYKSELLPHWRFRTPEAARVSSQKLYAMYEEYKARGDFVGMDMARKFLQMGYTRARRYANHKSGQKYEGPVPPERRGQSGAWGRAVRPLEPDPEKAASAQIFWALYRKVMEDPLYIAMRKAH